MTSGKSVEYFGSTATLMIGVAMALISVNGGQAKVVDRVALFKIYCSKLPAPGKKNMIKCTGISHRGGRK